MDDVIINKAATIERCINRIREKYKGEHSFLESLDQQDLIILNIQRAIQASIDMATHIVRINRWGVPQTYGENFEILHQNKFITSELSDKLFAMVGFRNIAIHDYQRLNLDIVIAIVNSSLSDIEEFATLCIKSPC